MSQGKSKSCAFDFSNDDLLYVTSIPLHKISNIFRTGGNRPSPVQTGFLTEWKPKKAAPKKQVRPTLLRTLLRSMRKRRSAYGFSFTGFGFANRTSSPPSSYEGYSRPRLRSPDVQIRYGKILSNGSTCLAVMVGFGTLKFAIRSSIQSSQDRKQVAVLCHQPIWRCSISNTFKERLGDFAIKSRLHQPLRTAKQIKEIVAQ